MLIPDFFRNRDPRYRNREKTGSRMSRGQDLDIACGGYHTFFLTHWPSVSPSRGLGFKDSVILSITLSIALLYTQTLVDCAAVWRTRLQRQRYSVNHAVNRSTSHTDTGRLCRRLADSTSVQRDSSGDSC